MGKYLFSDNEYLKAMPRRIIKYLVIFFGSLLIPLFLYFFFACIFTLIPVNSQFKQAENGIQIFVTSNGVHTDIWLPVKTETMDWTGYVDTNDFEKSASPFQYISFGWGDKGFYLETPAWSDLKFSIAFKAVFLPTSSAMHVAYYEKMSLLNNQAKKISIEKEQYIALAEYIMQSFAVDKTEKNILIDCCRYAGMNDNFYEATGSFHLFMTCNQWTNKALKEAGIKTALWAPFDGCVLYHL